MRIVRFPPYVDKFPRLEVVFCFGDFGGDK